MMIRLTFCFFLCFPLFLNGQVDTISVDNAKRVRQIPNTSNVQVDSIGNAEQIDTSAGEEIKQKTKRSFSPPSFLQGSFYKYQGAYPNPKASLTLSLLLPGAGQVYNKKYWKLPLIYAGLGGMIYMLNDSSNKYLAYRTAYKRSLQGLDYSNPIIDPSVGSQAALKIERDKFDKRRTLYYFGTGLTYGLFALEAFVDAHLQSFDISKDLSMDIQPQLDPMSGMPLLSLQIHIKK